MIVTSRIKTRILSLAFNGLLVDYSNKSKQNTILDRIHNEQKAYNPVMDDERLVSVPSYWNWSRLAYLTYNHGQTIPIDDFCYIDVGTLDNVHHRLAAKENHVTAKEAPSRARKIIEFEDVLYSTVRPYLHNICIVDKEFSKTPIASTAFCVMHARKEVLLYKFLFYWLLTSEFDKYSNGDPSKGALYPAIGEKDLLNGVIPVPSIEEQALIVERIDAAFSALDTIDTLQSQYQDNLATLKSKIIDAGIQGKLTEQLPEDGTAEKLYQQIQQEKRKVLVMRGGREDKSIKPIEDDVPYILPPTWKWIRFGDIGLFKKGPFGSALTKSMFVPKSDTTIKVYEQQHAINKNKNLGTYYITKKYFDEKMRGFEVCPGDVIISCAGTIGETYIMPDDIEQGIINQALMRVTIVPSIDKKFFQLFFDARLKRNAQSQSNGSAINNIPPFEVLKNWYFPLPPLAEQKRIVAKLDELLPLCERLK